MNMSVIFYFVCLLLMTDSGMKLNVYFYKRVLWCCWTGVRKSHWP